VEEARAYLADPVLGERLRECTEALMKVPGRSASEIFGYPDDLKLCSSLTLFAQLTPPQSVFNRALDAYFPDGPDGKTLQILRRKGFDQSTTMES
jgi:uncharacterized protein (DUF1810 family)